MRVSARTGGLSAVACLVSAAALATGSAAGASTSPSAGCDPSVTYSADEVAAAAAPNVVTSIYAVPKCFPDGAPMLAYLPYDLSIPILLEYNDGVEDVADFYGADLLVSDLSGQTAETLNRYEAMTARDPDVIGTMINDSDNALYQRVQTDGRQLLLSGPVVLRPTRRRRRACTRSTSTPRWAPRSARCSVRRLPPVWRINGAVATSCSSASATTTTHRQDRGPTRPWRRRASTSNRRRQCRTPRH